jgi:AcrR family transcriptional regulator
MQTAIRLFANHGYDAVGVQQIVEEAGVTKPTLYHYFGSKQRLIEIIFQEEGSALIQQVGEATAYNGDIRGSIQRVMIAYFEYAQAHPMFYRMLLTMWFAPPSSDYFLVMRDLQQQQIDFISEMFLKATEHHGNMRGRHVQYAISLRGLIDTYIGMYLQGFTDLQDEAQRTRIQHQFLHGIFS